MTLLTLVLIVVIILAVIGLGWQTFSIAVLDGFDRTLDVGIPIIRNLTQEAQATAGNPNTPELEIMAAPGEPNPQVRQLAFGGICAFDDNVQTLEEELNTEFSDAVIDALRTSTFVALNDSAASSNAVNAADSYDDNDDPEDLVVLGNPEDC